MPTEAATARSPIAARQAWLDEFASRNLAVRNGLRRAELCWSWARLAAFLLMAVAALRGPTPTIRIAWTAAQIVLFGWCVRRHRAVRTRRDFKDRVLLVESETRQRLGGHVVTIRDGRRPDEAREMLMLPRMLDDGPTWRLTAQERDDLDLYAASTGVFGLLNRTSMVFGALRLRDAVEHPMLSPERIRLRQSSITALGDDSRTRIELLASASIMRGRDDALRRLTAAISLARELGVPIRSRLLRAAAVGNVVLFLCSLMFGLQGSTAWAITSVACLAVGAALFQLVRQHTGAALAPWRGTTDAADALACAVADAHRTLPDASGQELGHMASSLGAAARRSGLRALCTRLAWNESGGPVRAALNALSFFDLFLAESLLACVVARREALLAAIAALAELEAQASFACFAWEQQVTCRPEVRDAPGEHDDGAELLSISNGIHPLLSPERAVGNTLTLSRQQRVWILTGSNMAGKSTFLRMVAINILLAQRGAACAAAGASIVPVRLVTDLRARDDLSRAESYFLAEVRQLHRMIEPDVHGAASPLLGLIDEPLRGTNSAERVAASLAMVEHLLRSGHLFLIATHEQRLTELADGVRAANRHFRENLTADAPTFDYVLRDGPATTRNALRVMRREGFPASLIQRAEELAAMLFN